MNYVRTYKLTAFEPTGELITEDTFTAETDDAAKEKGQVMLEEKNLLEQNTSPCLSSWEIVIVPFIINRSFIISFLNIRQSISIIQIDGVLSSENRINCP